MVEPGFGQAKPVKRRGIVVAHPRIPRALQHRLRLVFGNRAIEIAKGGGAEPQFGKGQTAVSDPVPMACRQCHGSPPSSTDMLE